MATSGSSPQALESVGRGWLLVGSQHLLNIVSQTNIYRDSTAGEHIIFSSSHGATAVRMVTYANATDANAAFATIKEVVESTGQVHDVTP